MTEDRRSGERRRTLAIHGRNAAVTSLLTPQSVAASNPCLNCGTNVQLEFCPECGQRAIDPDPTIREFLRELAEEFLHWDGKLLATLRLMIAQPGALTQEYFEGKRVRYISPLRLYLTCSILYFFLGAVLPSGPLPSAGKGTAVRAGPISIGTSDSVRSLAQLDSLSQRGNMVSRMWATHVRRAMRNSDGLSASVAAAMPRTLFVLLPVFAGLFALFFRDRRRRYPQHLAFAMHVHAVLFLALTGILVSRTSTVLAIQLAGIGLVAVGIGVYATMAAQRVYGGSRLDVVTRVAGVYVTYLVAFGAAMFATFGIIILAS